MSCLALFCLVAVAIAPGFAGPVIAVAAACYRATLRGISSSRYWPGDRGDNTPAYMRYLEANF